MFLEPRKHAANIEIIILKHKLFLIWFLADFSGKKALTNWISYG